MAKVITQRTVEAAKLPSTGRTAKPDGIVPGMQFVAHAGGKKSFRLRARVHGKLVNFDIGDASLVTLADARIKAKGFLAEIAGGKDPREAKQEAARAAAESVEATAREFIKRHVKVHNKPRTAAETERLIERNVLPKWGKRPITSISQRDVHHLLDAVVDRGAPIAANRVFAAAKTMFTWARRRGLISTSPFELVEAPIAETSRNRVLDDFELALVLQAADRLGYPFGKFVKILALTGQRREEVAGMMWAELDPDLSVWVIPRSRTKNSLEHVVPITLRMRSILASVPRLGDSPFVFTTTGTSSISGYSRAKVTLDAAIKELNGGKPIEPWRLHDLRRSMASHLARLGVQLPVVEKLLNHAGGVSFGGIAGVYQRHDFADEKRRALELWAQHLLPLDLGAPRVVALRR
jgi:integrase